MIHKSFFRVLPFVTIGFSTLALAGCWGGGARPPLPSGEQVMSGSLIPTEISISRRGSHILRQDGKDVYYVESTRVNLRALENRDVVIRGLLQENSDPSALPVLVADEAEVIAGNTREWSFPQFGPLSISTPSTWAKESESGSVIFAIQGTDSPILAISYRTGKELPDGEPIVIDRKRASRSIDDETGAQTVSVSLDEHVLTLAFTPSEFPVPEKLKIEWLALLQSISFTVSGQESSDVSPPTGSGSVSGSGSPCGGSAGILCPAGEFCAITDAELNVGRCQGVR